MAQVLTEVTGKPVKAKPLSSEQFLRDQGADSKTLDPYFYIVAESFKQIENGQLSYISTVRDDIQTVLDRKGITVRQWIKMHQEELMQLAHGQDSPHTAWGAKRA